VAQLQNTVEEFVSRVIPDTRTVIRTRPLEALIIGGWVARVVGPGHREPFQRQKLAQCAPAGSPRSPKS
jgi:hypothetical protein